VTPNAAASKADRNAVPDRVLGVGVVGLGRAFIAMADALASHPAIRIAGAADPRPEAQVRFVQDFGAPCHDSLETLCRDPAIDAVYIATPHQHHQEHVCIAARHGKHIIVEKPMALTLEACDAMIAAAEREGVALIVGHTHSFDPPVRKVREIVRGGEFGAVRMISALNYTDFLYRPRRPEELATDLGGGVLFNQAPHHVDIVRLIGGGLVRSVRAVTGVWDPSRPTEGSYAAFLQFEDGAVGSLVYSGYGRFNTDEFCGWIGEVGRPKDPDAYGAARQRLAAISSSAEEAKLKAATGYGGPSARAIDKSGTSAPFHEHFGLIVVSCERGDLRPTPEGVLVYGDDARRMIAMPHERNGGSRAAVIDELYDAVIRKTPPIHDGRWAKATLEVCLAILESSRRGTDIRVFNQSRVAD
jgi:phthalate 4,5-cis-dihydrodiol dehydrogenase